MRSVDRSPSEPRRRELTAAINYLAAGRGLPGPSALSGTSSLSEVLEGLPRLESHQRREGLLTFNLHAAATLAGFDEAMTSLAPAPAGSIGDRFDQLALVAGAAMLRNLGNGLDAFTMLHGVTVSTMASELLPYLPEDGRRQLEAAVVGFVVAAIIGFDMNPLDTVSYEPTTTEPIVELAMRVASSLDDHDIKFAAVCRELAERRPEALVQIRAMLESQI